MILKMLLMILLLLQIIKIYGDFILISNSIKKRLNYVKDFLD